MSQQPPGWTPPPPPGQQPWPPPQPPPPPPGGYGAGPGGYGTGPGGYGPPPSPGINGLAVASMICSTTWLYGVGSVLALIFGYIAKSQIRQRGETGGALATAGIIIGWIGLAGAVIVITLIVIGAASEDDLGLLGP